LTAVAQSPMPVWLEGEDVRATRIAALPDGPVA
jgi:hypothetical protein